MFQVRHSFTTESAWQQKREAIAAKIDELEDYRKDLRDGWVRYLAAEYSGGKPASHLLLNAPASKNRGKNVVGDSDEEQ